MCSLAAFWSAVGDDPGVGFDRDVHLEPVADGAQSCARGGIGVHHRDHPVLDDVPIDLPPPVGAIKACHRFDYFPAIDAATPAPQRLSPSF